MPQDQRSPSSNTLEHLNLGNIEIVGRMQYSSNATFLVDVSYEATTIRAIYKPHRGERSLWDFPDGLYIREVAAYELSVALRLNIIPETVLRMDGPLGEGSLQLFIEADFSEHYFSLFGRTALHAQFKRFALFDIIANNADRKSGHLLIDQEDKIWGIDQGLCFHTESKLRTVIWEFAGEEISDEFRVSLETNRESCVGHLANLISEEEISALEGRIDRLLKKKKFPKPDPDLRCYPWPLV